MSLTSSLFSGISGMTNLGNAMQIIGDNIANVNTTAFKASNYVFQDLLSQQIATQSGTAQVGRGMALGEVASVFEQGSFESTGNTTDLAIGGEGFFVLRESTTEQLYYSRAGNFKFDRDGVLINSSGYVAQGWALDDEGDEVGSVTDIRLASFTSPPKVSSNLTMITNLDSDALSKSVVLANAWDAEETTPIAGSGYNYQSVVKVYDSLGSTHDITIYYDKQSESKWEYIVTCNPDEDKRGLVQETSAKGLLAKGEITFSDSSGTISNMTMREFTGRIGNLSTNGAITDQSTNFTINNYDALSLDGYNFSLEFDGTNWSFEDIAAPAGVITAADLPANYPFASIIGGDANGIRINLDGDTDRTADLTIAFTNPAQATDSLSFDIINPQNIHIQDVTNTQYIGDTGNENTQLEISHPEVLTTDSSDLRINWDASEESWYWAMPLLQNVTTMDTSSLTPANLTGSANVTNAEVMTSYSDNTTVWFDSNTNLWNFVSPYARELSNQTFAGGITQANTSVVISDPTVLQNHSTGIQLAWDNIVGLANLAYSNTSGANEILATNTTITVSQEENFTRDSSIAYILEYDGVGDTWVWGAGGDPVVDYLNRQNPTWDSVSERLSVDLTGDGADFIVDFSVAGGLTAASDGDTISFRIDADGSWTWAMPTYNIASTTGGIVPTNITGNISSALTAPAAYYDSATDVGGPNYNLVYTDATNTWSWDAAGHTPAAGGAGATNGTYASETFIVNNENEVSIDLDADGLADVTYTFTAALAADGTLNFSIDPAGNPPPEYSSADIASTSGSDILSIDMTGNGTSDLVLSFLSPLTSNGTITFDIDTHIPPFEYPNASIDNVSSNASALYVDLNGDNINDVNFSFLDAGVPQALTDNGTFVFDIDPRVPPTEYSTATLSGDRDEVMIDMNNDGENDIVFTFATPLPSGASAQDSAIKFDIEGTTAWNEVSTNSNGYYEFMADFLGGDLGITENGIEFNIGTKDDGTGQFINDSLTTTQYARSSTTTFQSADGYGAGDLEGVDVDTDGVMTGIYSNGQLIPLYRIALANFLNEHGLYKLGGNLYRETRNSGTAITNKPGTNGLGSITPNSLEQSNVDIANEFVKMITTQRAFQANSKIVTTVDAMLGEVIAMKR
ncbi:MAG: flagellar hook-basal body complex protein [Pseudomonadota bacterium]